MAAKTKILWILLGFFAVTLGSAAVLTGKISDGNGSAVAGAQLYLTPMPLSTAPCGFGAPLDSTVSGSDGSFRLQAAAEFYNLHAVKSGFADACDFLELKDSGSFKGMRLSAVSNPGITLIGVTLRAKPEGQRLPGVRLILETLDGKPDTLITDANGEFRIGSLAPANQYGIRAEKDSFNIWGESFYELTSGETRTLRIELEHEPARPGPPGSVSGIITDSHTGQPVPGAMVTLFEVKSSYLHEYDDSTLTDAQGRYQFIGVPADTELGAGFVLRAAYPRCNVGQSNLFNMRPKENLNFDLQIEKIVTLSLFAGASGALRPLPKAHITMQPSVSNYSPQIGWTDTSGRIGFKEIAVGDAGITVALKGYRSVFIRKNISGKVWDESLSVALETVPDNATQSLHGTPQYPGGSGLAGNLVMFRSPLADSSFLFFTYTNPDGTFSFEGIPSACTHGALISPVDSLAVSLSGALTEVTYTVHGYPISMGIRPSSAKPTRSSWRGWFQGFDLLGKRLPGRKRL